MKQLFFLLVSLLPCTARSEPADTVFLNGNIYPVNDAQPHAEAIAVTGERIDFVGSNEPAKKQARPKTGLIDRQPSFLAVEVPYHK